MFHGRLDCSEMLINEGANTALAARIQESPADSVSGKSYVKMPLFLFSAKIYLIIFFVSFFSSLEVTVSDHSDSMPNY